MSDKLWRSTTIACVRKGNQVAMAGDGQVTLGDTVMKGNATKIRKLYKGKVLSGFAGSAADAFSLLDKFEVKLEQYGGDILRAGVELAKEWRTDKILRNLEALLIVADKNRTLIISGDGNLVDPEDDIATIGSGGAYAKAAGLAMLENNPDLKAKEIVKKSLEIASRICIYTNSNISVEELEA